MGTDKKFTLYEIRNAGRTFGGNDGVRIGELDIPGGEMVAILGRSGSGKSTLLNLLGNLLQGHGVNPNDEGEDGAVADVDFSQSSILFRTPDKVSWKQGDVKFNTQELIPTSNYDYYLSEISEYLPWTSSSLIRREAGYVFQEAYLLKNATVSANLALPLRLRGTWSLSIDATHVDHVAQHLERNGASKNKSIYGKLTKRSWPLSGGQAQRVAVGRAVIRHPSVIIADEPTASLDPELGHHIIAMLRKWQSDETAEVPRSVIWATHSMEHAARFADRVIILQDGRLPELPDDEAFKEKFGHSWPLKNPQDHALLKRWLDGWIDDKEFSQENVEWHEGLRLQQVGEAPSLTSKKRDETDSEEVPKKTKERRFGLLWRLALSEIFNHKDVDNGVGSPLLTKAVSVNDAELDGNSGILNAYKKISVPSSLSFPITLIVGAVLIAFGLLLELTAFGLGFEGSPQWTARSVIVAGIIVILYPYFRPFWRSAGNKWEFATYFIIVLLLAGAIKGHGVIDKVFEARFKSPELSNTVIEARLLRAKLNDEKLAKLDETLVKLGFTAPNLTTDKKVDPKSNRFAFGRYEAVGISIDKLPPDWKPTSSSVSDWGSLGKKKDNTGSNTCTVSREAKDAEILAIDMKEPMVSSLVYYSGSTYSGLRRSTYQFKTLKNNENGLSGVYMTRKMLRLLGYKGEEKEPKIGTYFCMDLFGNKVVWLAGILESIPNDSSSDYQVLIDREFYRRAFYDKQSQATGSGRYPENYNKTTLYMDTSKPSSFIHAVECASSAASRNKGGCSSQLIETIKNNLEFSFRVEGGFDKIKQAISLSDFFKQVSSVILAAFLFLAMLLTLKNSSSYILNNERSLCVMRAFGANVGQILYLILMQFSLILLPGLVLASAIAFYIWPTTTASLALLLNIDKSVVMFSAQDAMVIMLYLLGALLAGCLFAVLSWWAGSRWIAERMKQVG